jgi:hypothetical protein
MYDCSKCQTPSAARQSRTSEAKLDECFETSRLPLEVGDHRAIEPRPVPIVVAVHLSWVVAVGELQERASSAPDEAKRPPRDGLIGRSGEDSRQSMFAEIEHVEQTLGTAEPATRQRRSARAAALAFVVPRRSGQGPRVPSGERELLLYSSP